MNYYTIHPNQYLILTEIKIYIYIYIYTPSSGRQSSHLMILILFEHSSQRGLGKGIYLLILFSTLLASYVSSLLFQIVPLSTKWRASFISIYDHLYIMSHVNLRSKLCPGSIKFLAPPLQLTFLKSHATHQTDDNDSEKSHAKMLKILTKPQYAVGYLQRKPQLRNKWFMSSFRPQFATQLWSDSASTRLWNNLSLVGIRFRNRRHTKIETFKGTAFNHMKFSLLICSCPICVSVK